MTVKMVMMVVMVMIMVVTVMMTVMMNNGPQPSWPWDKLKGLDHSGRLCCHMGKDLLA